MTLGHWDGPLESGSFPDQLLARVITPGSTPRVHGYDVQNDLALNYGLVDVAFLALTGELPESGIGLALNAVLVVLAPVSVACAPTHAAVLSKLCGAGVKSTLAVATIALAEQARHIVDEHADLLDWLENTARPFPSRHVAVTQPDRDAVHRLERALEGSALVAPGMELSPTLDAAILLVLHACGLRSAAQLQAILVWARLPLVMSEALAESEANLRRYPINLPRFVYEEETP